MRAAGILPVFCLFCSILSTVTSLKCQTCVALGKECEGEAVKVVECKEDEEFCSTVVANTTIINTAMSLIVKECSTRENCFEGLFSTTTVDGRFEVARANCCDTDVCNAEPLLLEKYEEFQPNGLQCPGCFALDEDHCKANQSVVCVGKEDRCLTITSTTEAFVNFTEKSTYQGCTTQNSCSFPLGFSETAGGLIQFNITTLECRNASSSEPDLQL
uniref:UPAR/Ly6 domain-containing protein n=1 Tax=Laticauda laticaudata TaxID=8630 RepID=A0A8C5RLR7_LATLA